MPHVLLVDDEPNLREVLGATLKRNGFTVTLCDGPAAAILELDARRFDVVITDERMPTGTSRDVLAACRERDPHLPVVVLTAHATVDLAVAVLRDGAFDFITKPFIPAAVTACVRRAAKQAELSRENARLKRSAVLAPDTSLIGESDAMARVRSLIAKVAPTQAPVLVTGETGTGKELVARAIHAASPRAAEAFVAVNCAALPEALLESELFGHERGAFTGADSTVVGLFEAADGGTLLLDEAGEMALSLQAKLLRVLMDGEFRRVGSTRTRRADVRVIAATHRVLTDEVKAGRFREDLFYRLSVFPVEMPPLRSRREDIPSLIQYFVTRVAIDLGMPPAGIDVELVNQLSAYSFPGNVRELRNLIERAYILASGPQLLAEHLPLTGLQPTRGFSTATLDDWVAGLKGPLDLRALLDSAERLFIEKAMLEAASNQTRAAESLGISRPDLAYKLKRHGLR